jgi:hypothetical protein
MLLLEFYDRVPTNFQDVENDNSQPRWGETRKTKLTLAAINKIRRMNEVQAYEKAKNLKKIRQQYAPPAQSAL